MDYYSLSQQRLLVQQRITFVVIYKCPRGLAPPYLEKYCILMSFHAGHYHLQSADAFQLIVPHTRINYGDRSFSVNDPIMWNSLSHVLQSCDRLFHMMGPLTEKLQSL